MSTVCVESRVFKLLHSLYFLFGVYVMLLKEKLRTVELSSYFS